MNCQARCAAVLLVFSGGALAGPDTPLTIKGVKIGDPPQVACPESPVTNSWDEHAQSMKGFGVDLKPLKITECDPAISRTAGIPADEPAHIIFNDGKLIFFKFTLSDVSLEKQGDILQALKAEFGPWRVRRVYGISTFTWTRGGTELAVERSGPALDGAELGFFLRDVKRMSEYTSEIDRVSKILNKQVSQERGRTVLQRD